MSQDLFYMANQKHNNVSVAVYSSFWTPSSGNTWAVTYNNSTLCMDANKRQKKTTAFTNKANLEEKILITSFLKDLKTKIYTNLKMAVFIAATLAHCEESLDSCTEVEL